MITIDKTIQEVFDTFNMEQKRVVTELIASAFDNKMMPRIEILGGYTHIRSILDSLDTDQQLVTHYLIGCAAMKRLTPDDLQVLKGDTNE